MPATTRLPLARASFRAGLVALALASCAAPVTHSAYTQRGDYGPRVGDRAYTDRTDAQPYQLDTHLGLRQLRQDEAWSPLDNQLDVGVTVRTPIAGSGLVSFDVGARYAYDESTRGGIDEHAQTIELDAGLLMTLARPGALVQPYFGAGLALLFVEAETVPTVGDPTRDREAAVGRYVRGGLAVEFRPAQLVGIELRYLDAGDVTLNNQNFSVDSIGVALTFGARF
ncbi:MAG: hypothetical protein R3F49_12290 [Planctomycetota bacterium]